MVLAVPLRVVAVAGRPLPEQMEPAVTHISAGQVVMDRQVLLRVLLSLALAVAVEVRHMAAVVLAAPVVGAMVPARQVQAVLAQPTQVQAVVGVA